MLEVLLRFSLHFTKKLQVESNLLKGQGKAASASAEEVC